jgi:dCMP deaminase
MSKKLIENIKSIGDRLDWNEYFMTMAYLVSRRSSCHRLKVGCVLVKDNRIVSSGYNGHLPNTKHRSIVRNNHEQLTVHSEVNSILDCAKRNVSTDGCTAYVTHFPCLNCFKSLITAGIQKIVYAEDYKNDEIVIELQKELGIEINKY